MENIYLVPNLLRTLCTKFNQNGPSIVQNVTETRGLFFSRTRCILAQQIGGIITYRKLWWQTCVTDGLWNSRCSASSGACDDTL